MGQIRGRTEIAPDQREKFLQKFQQVQQGHSEALLSFTIDWPTNASNIGLLMRIQIEHFFGELVGHLVSFSLHQIFVMTCLKIRCTQYLCGLGQVADNLENYD